MSPVPTAGRRALPWALAAVLAVLVAMPAWGPSGGSTVGGPPVLSAPFSANTRIDRGTRNVYNPAIAIDGGGTLHVVWSDDRNAYRRIYYSNSADAGTVWSPDAEIDGATGTASAYDPALAVDASGGPLNGSVYVVWLEAAGGNHVILRRSPDRGATWGPRVEVDGAPTGTGVLSPTVAVSPTGLVFVAWPDTRNGTLEIFVRRTGDGGTTWSAATQVSQAPTNSALPSLAMSGGFVFLAWRDLDPVSLVPSLWFARSSNAGASWTAGIVDTGPAPTDRQYPQVFAAPDGTVHLVWIGSDSGGVPAIRASASTDSGATWSPPARVDSANVAPIRYNAPRMASALGDLYGVWSDNRNGDPDIFYTTSRDGGGTWGTGLPGGDGRIDDTDTNANLMDDATNQTSPTVASDGYSVFAAWADDRAGAGYQLYFSRYVTTKVEITEFQDAPVGSQAVEIAAFGSAPVSLAGYILDVDGTAWDLSPLGALGSGQDRVVGDPPWADLVYPLTLGDEGGVLRIVDGTGAAVDTVAYGQRGPVPDPIAGESVSRHWTGLSYSSGWARTPVPTWRAQNDAPAPAADPPVVLNEVLFNPLAASDAFIELFYRGSTPFSLLGYTVAADASFPLPPVSLTASDPYYVLRQADAPALFAALIAPGDNVYLYNATGSLQDMAGWSSGHTPGSAMVRVPEGTGGHEGFDDASSAAAGWRFDQPPVIPLVILRQDQTQDGDLGQAVSYSLTVLHKESAADILEISYATGPDVWGVSFVDRATGLALQDHDGDGLPDTGLLAPGAVFAIDVSVQIPSAGPVADIETTVVTASSHAFSFARASVTLTTGTFPRIEPSASVDRNPVYVVGSPPTYITDTNLTLTIAGRGTARVRRAPQDTVLLLDRSGSLADIYCPGCFTLLKEAAKTYVANLTLPDQAAVIYFREYPIPKGPLTTDYPLVMSEIDSETTPFGGTQIGEALQAANAELATDGNPSHFWAIILLTDGQDNPGGLDPRAEARISASLGIRVFTIGLGPDADPVLLGDIANITGGQYLYANTPQDLAGIYAKIGTLITTLAGYDSDLTDDIPMVQVVLPPYLQPTGPYTDPVTGASRPPDYRAGGPTGTVLQWNVSALHLNQSWAVKFPVRSTQVGVVDVFNTSGSRAEYQRWDGTTVVLAFPQVLLTVLEVTPVRYTITRTPLAGTAAVDGVLVDGVWYPAPATFSWWPGDVHTIEAPAENASGPGSRYYLEGWDDSGTPSHSVLVGSADATITARYWVQVRPTVHLLGTDAVHDVGVDATFAGAAANGRASGTWSGWVDVGHPLTFDSLAAGSGAAERWITLEDFALPPWAAVTTPFVETVLYYHQYALRVETRGLVPRYPAHLASTAFNATTNDSVSATWAGWIDAATTAAIDAVVTVSAWEQYRTSDPVTWYGDAPHDAVVRYAHEVRADVKLVGTDASHTVGVAISAPGGDRRADARWTDWSDWVEIGGTLSFDRATSGTPPRTTSDPTEFDVRAPLNATITYVATVEMNYKPLFSAIYVAVLVALGVNFAWRRPLAFGGRRREAERPRDTRRRVARDRRRTALLVVLPVALLEGAIGAASYVTGFFRIPEQGVWVSLGLVVNTVILAAGVGGQIAVRAKGYEAEEELLRAAAAERSGAGSAVPPPPADEHDEKAR